MERFPDLNRKFAHKGFAGMVEWYGDQGQHGYDPCTYTLEQERLV